MTLGTFACEISNGASWVNLNDHVNFQVNGESLGESATQRRRIMATSVVIEGEYEVHSVRSNITEDLKIWVLGATQGAVSSNLDLLITLLSQVTYSIRLTRGNSRETWTCFSADYAISRNQVFSHNGRAAVSAQVPRLPATTYEVV